MSEEDGWHARAHHRNRIGLRWRTGESRRDQYGADRPGIAEDRRPRCGQPAARDRPQADAIWVNVDLARMATDISQQVEDVLFGLSQPLR